MDETENHKPGSTPSETRSANQDYTRQLGVVEALTSASRQCPNASVRIAASQALESLGEAHSGGLRDQVFFVLTAMRGWRGDRARQVHDSLSAFLAGDATRSGRAPDA